MNDQSKCSEWSGHPLQGKLEDGLQPFIDRTALLCSIAISLKRIADSLQTYDKYGLTGTASLAQSIVDGLKS